MKLTLSTKDAVGVGIALAGLILLMTSFLVIQSHPLTAMSMGVVVSGLSIIMTPIHVSPKKALREALLVFARNLEALLESLNAKGNAIYTWRNGKPLIIIPLRGDVDHNILDCNLGINIYGKKALLCIEPLMPGVTLSESEEKVFLSLNEYLVEKLSIAIQASYTRSGDLIIVTVDSPKLPLSPGRMGVTTGSLPSLLSGVVLSNELGAPIKFIEEKIETKSLVATFEVLSK